jgi:carbonic anhydrase
MDQSHPNDTNTHGEAQDEQDLQLAQSQIRDKEWQQIFLNNKKWVEEKISSDPNYFSKLTLIQKPDFLWIGCADSRVPANEIVGLRPGEIFVHRNIANLVISTDINAQSVIEYAVRHLKVKHIIVCGHYGCGGVKHALDCQDAGFLNPWITHIRDVYRIHQSEIDTHPDFESKLKKLVELNVLESCLTLMKNYTIQESYQKNRFPIIHACVYDLSNGFLKDLGICFVDQMKEFEGIYWMMQSRLNASV